MSWWSSVPERHRTGILDLCRGLDSMKARMASSSVHAVSVQDVRCESRSTVAFKLPGACFALHAT